MKPFLLALSFAISMFSSGQLVTKKLVAANKVTIGFYQFTPSDYNSNPTKKFPVIIFLHGIGERGNGTTDLPKLLGHGIPKTINSGHPMKFYWNGKWESFIVLAPQLSTAYGNWPTFYPDEMIKYAKQNLRIDTDRIILTGLSLGGGGAWAYPSESLQNAESLAALGVVCGVSGGGDACNISKAKLPVWAFHASNDNTVSISNTNNTISKIIACKNPVEPVKTIWPTGGHFIWDRAYDKDYKWQNPNIYEWFLAQNRSLPVNVRPRANGGKDISVSKSKGLIQLSGALSKDSDGKLVRYIWNQISGPSSSVLSNPVSEDGLTKVTGLTIPGIYQFELKAIDDRAEYSFDTVKVTVIDGAAPNIAPIPYAGDDLEIATTRTFLSGNKSYDPDGKITSFKWSKVDGPGQYNIVNENAPVAEVFNLGSGIYKFQLETIDNEGAKSFDTIRITEISMVLPVTFKSFRLKNDPEGNRISWIIDSEHYKAFYKIDKSLDGKTFKTIGTIMAGNNEGAENAYTYLDREDTGVLSFYRIRYIMSDGTEVYSSIVSSSATTATIDLKCYPVPSDNTVTIQVTGQKIAGMQVKIYSLTGKLLEIYKQETDAGLFEKVIDIGKYPSGMYIVEASGKNIRPVQKRIIRY